MQVKRGADVDSEHHLLVTKLKLKLRKSKNGQKRKQRLDKLKLEDKQSKIPSSWRWVLRNNTSILQNRAAITIDAFNKATTEAAK